MKITYITSALLGLATISQGATVFEATFDNSLDGFTSNPSANGTIATTATALQSHRNADNSGAETTNIITRTVDTVGFTGITLNLTAFQSNNGTWEGGESLLIEVDTGGGFSSIFNDAGLLGAGGAGTSTGASFSTGSLAIGAGADNGNFDLRITMTSGFYGNGGPAASAEVYNLDNLLVEGTAVPEPSSVALLGLGGLALILRRRK